MKPNDKAYQAARAAILKAIANRNCIIAGVPFNENNVDEFDSGEAIEHAKVALDAAYAAQFQSEDYAGLIEELRLFGEGKAINDAADAIEALLADRSEHWENKKRFAIAHAALRTKEISDELETLKTERDALAARLALVDDDALVERERCAKKIEPAGPRPCDCDSCDCGNKDDAERVAAWDEAMANAAAIRSGE